MSKQKDITTSLVLISIFLIIFALVFYLFVYSGSRPQSPPQTSIKKAQENPPEALPNVETKYKGKSVYVLDPRIKIRSEPREDATVADEKSKGDMLTVTGAHGDWFEVEFDAGKKGWVLREQVSDKQPPPPKVEKPPEGKRTPDNSQTIDLIRADMDQLVAFVNQQAVQQFAQEMITGFEIRDNGNQLTIYVTKTWYILPLVQKQILFNLAATRYGRQTCLYRIRPECSTNDFPTINFLNPENREVARMSANQPLQIFE